MLNGNVVNLQLIGYNLQFKNSCNGKMNYMYLLVNLKFLFTIEKYNPKNIYLGSLLCIWLKNIIAINKMFCSYYSSSSNVENLQLIVHVIMSWNAIMQILHELCLMAKKFDNQGFVYYVAIYLATTVSLGS